MNNKLHVRRTQRVKGHTKYIKKGTKLPKFKPLPTKLINARDALRNYFASIKTYARFYGDYLELFTGKRRRFSFQVFLDSGFSGAEKYELVSSICDRLLNKKVPIHEPGQIFTYHELLHHTPWTPVRRLLQYEVWMRYG